MAKKSNRRTTQFKPTETLYGTRWYDLRDVGLEGRVFDDTEHFYHRFPARAKEVVRPGVWDMACKTSGLYARFVTDAAGIEVRWTLRAPIRSMNMAANSTCGLDLYVRDGKPGSNAPWRLVSNARPGEANANTALLISGLKPEPREFMLYLPLYSGLEFAHIGLPIGASITPPPRWPNSGRPMCFYGTSITHGGCASRPGMSYPAIISRLLDRPLINLAVDGNAQMDLAVAKLFAGVEASVFVIDPVHNMSMDMINQNAEPFIRELHRAHPKTPIVLMSATHGRAGALNAPYSPKVKNDAFRAVVNRLLAAGVRGLHFVEAEKFLGEDGEGTADGVHPSDLGFMRMAEALILRLRKLG
ncbi:MAG: SGNH/GDSL hydrolase family protein [Planctomycetes bacterium]|nr:SGNH/GDSL hydrolase family protein [Planctomycetota bacterium]